MYSTQGLLALTIVLIALGVYHFDNLYLKELFHFPMLKSFIDSYKRPLTTHTEQTLFTKEHLWHYFRGLPESKGVYVGFFGKVYDVSKGKKHYGPDGSYHFFAGRDATKAFVTGKFTEEGLVDNIADFETEKFLEVENWIKFYEETYPCVGKVIGHFYDGEGNETPQLVKYRSNMELARKLKEEEESLKVKMPSCNTMNSQQNGNKVWCTQKSGGVERSWIGFPRLFQPPGGAKARCVCLEKMESDQKWLSNYPGCKPDSSVCVLN